MMITSLDLVEEQNNDHKKTLFPSFLSGAQGSAVYKAYLQQILCVIKTITFLSINKTH